MDKQGEFQNSNFPQIGALNRNEQLLHHTRALIHETIEVERELNYKYWKKPVEISWDQVKNEIVDQFIFLLNECNAVDMSAEELFNRTIVKQAINKKRQESGY